MRRFRNALRLFSNNHCPLLLCVRQWGILNSGRWLLLLHRFHTCAATGTVIYLPIPFKLICLRPGHLNVTLLVNGKLLSLPTTTGKNKYSEKERNRKKSFYRRHYLPKALVWELLFLCLKQESPDPLFPYFINTESITCFRRKQGVLKKDVCKNCSAATMYSFCNN